MDQQRSEHHDLDDAVRRIVRKRDPEDQISGHAERQHGGAEIEQVVEPEQPPAQIAQRDQDRADRQVLQQRVGEKAGRRRHLCSPCESIASASAIKSTTARPRSIPRRSVSRVETLCTKSSTARVKGSSAPVLIGTPQSPSISSPSENRTSCSGTRSRKTSAHVSNSAENQRRGGRGGLV